MWKSLFLSTCHPSTSPCPMSSVPSLSHQLFSTVLLSHQGPLRTQIPWMLHKTQASPLKEDNLILVNSFTCHIEFQKFLQAVPLFVECGHTSGKSDKDKYRSIEKCKSDLMVPSSHHKRRVLAGMSIYNLHTYRLVGRTRTCINHTWVKKEEVQI